MGLFKKASQKTTYTKVKEFLGAFAQAFKELVTTGNVTEKTNTKWNKTVSALRGDKPKTKAAKMQQGVERFMDKAAEVGVRGVDKAAEGGRNVLHKVGNIIQGKKKQEEVRKADGARTQVDKLKPPSQKRTPKKSSGGWSI